jgi:transposase
MLNAIRYMARSGGGWRMLPTNFGPWQTVYWWFRRFVRRMLFQTIHDVSLMLHRERAGREASPTAGVLDSQTVKAPHGPARGYDAAKKTVGRKRHIVVDTDGRLLMLNLTTADVSDSAGAQLILDGVRKQWPWLKHLFADAEYARTKLLDKAVFRDFILEIVRRSDTGPGFKVLPRRWVVERTFGWMTRWRRLVRDYEARLDVSHAMIHVAMGSLLLRRLAHQRTILKRTLSVALCLLAVWVGNLIAGRTWEWMSHWPAIAPLFERDAMPPGLLDAGAPATTTSDEGGYSQAGKQKDPRCRLGHSQLGLTRDECAAHLKRRDRCASGADTAELKLISTIRS